MAKTIYVYLNNKITGPNGYAVDIVKSQNGKYITVEGSDNITLEYKEGRYIISHNFIEEGFLQKNSIMDYRRTHFSVDQKGIKNFKKQKINFSIYSGNKEIAYINTFKNSLNIGIEYTDYVAPVIIYISVLSRRLKTKFGHIYLRGKAMSIAGSSLYGLTGIFSMMRVGINPFIIFAVTVSSVVVFTVVIARISKKNIF